MARTRIRTVMAALGATITLVGLGAAGVSAAVGSPVTTTAPAGARAESSTITEYFHKIAARHSGDSLNVATGGTQHGLSIISWPFHWTQQNSQWSLDSVSGSTPPGFSGIFMLRARHSNQCIDVSGSPVAGAQLVQQPCNPTDTSQHWFYGSEADSGDPKFRFIYNRAAGMPGSGTEKVMKVDNGGPMGTKVILANKGVFSSSRFTITAPVHVTSTTEVFG